MTSASCSIAPESRRSDRIGRFVASLRARTGKLRQRNQRHVQLLGDALEVARNLADLVLAVFDMAVRAHQLQIVDHNHIQPVLHFQPSAAGTELRRRDAGRIVDIDIEAASGPSAEDSEIQSSSRSEPWRTDCMSTRASAHRRRIAS